ncbi:MAG: metallophosphoesterase [Bacteroidetes bacterium]|nr:metallophosphoesterase [Bacteroidota bacterium]
MQTIKLSFLLFNFYFLLPPNIQAQQTITGYVFVDKNNNGKKDAGEEGVAGVSVSDQVIVVKTSADGAFSISNPKGYGFIILSTPDGYKADSSWKRITKNSTAVNFPLAKTKPVREFSFIHASDTHVSPDGIDRMEKFRNIIAQTKPDLVLITGDLVKDALRVNEKTASTYFQLYASEIKKINVPVWSAPGNHDNFGIERQSSLVSKDNPLYGKEMFHHYLGPRYYSFNYGGVHFIALDDVDFEDTWYFGHIDSVQLNWVKQDLENVSPLTPIITFAHIPFFSGGLSLTTFSPYGFDRSVEIENGKPEFRHTVSNAYEFLALFKNHNYPLNLTGHYHIRQIFWFESYGQKIRFEQTAAVVGDSDAGDIQTPSGVTFYTVKDGVISEGKFIRLDQ